MNGRYLIWVHAAVAALLGLFLYWRLPAAPVMSPDSALYLRFDPVITATYPLFLRMTGAAAAPAVQVILYTLCSFTLAWTASSRLDKPFLGLILLVLLFANPEVNSYHGRILSESLFLSVDLLFVAASIMFVSTRRARWALAASALAGLAVTIRPISYPMAGAVWLVVMLIPSARAGWRSRAALLCGCILAWVAVVGGERAYSHAVQGNQLTSLVGPHLFAKAALIDAAPLPRQNLTPLERDYADLAEQGYKPVRDVLEQARRAGFYPVLRAFYEVCLQHGCSDSVRVRAGVSRAEAYQAMRKVALARIAENPAQFVKLTVDGYKALWVLNTRTHPSFAPQYDRFIASVGPLPLAGMIDGHVSTKTEPSRLAYVVRPFFILAGILIAAMVVVFGVWGLRRRDLPSVAAAALICALSVEGVMWFTAATGVTEGRYTMGMWPNMACALAFAAAVVSSGLLSWHKARRNIKNHGNIR